ncbi:MULTISPECIES: YcbK family protein [Methylomonas]|uniref:YcbK family protein n=1 Tax=Methylomonas TaxID=416 RepID=UPI001231C282|nr:DUF882 domain-containing protein [Methylomonas rhizoryzae]
MQQPDVDNSPQDESKAMVSRRSFFSRLAAGAILSLAVPGIAHAAKVETIRKDKGRKARSAVRLPKQKIRVSSKHKSGKISTASLKRVKNSAGRVNNHSRVRDVYSKKSNRILTTEYKRSVTSPNGQQYARVQPNRFNTSIYEPEQDSLILANRSRLDSHRSLAIQNPHTGDRLNVTYFERGRYLNDALGEISVLLRDYRTGDIHPVDPQLLDQLHDLKQILDLSRPFNVVCGYRSPLTNAKLHAEHTGVANNSFHMYGRAVDIRIERFDLRRIHNAAIAMHRGGVGYYPESNFIHLDTGTFRTWSL